MDSVGPHSQIQLSVQLATLMRFASDRPIAVADSLLRRFGSISGMLGADIATLVSTPNVTKEAAELLNATSKVVAAALVERLPDRQIVGSLNQLEEYLKMCLRSEPIRIARLIYLDRKNALLGDEEISRGSPIHLPLYPREVVRNALLMQASAVILIEHHPTSSFKPSADDIRVVKNINSSLSALEIIFHDYVVQTGGKLYSYRTSGHLIDN